MTLFKKALLGTISLAALIGAASAQVNTVPQVGVISNIVKQNTYSAVSLALVSASSATDIFCISAGTKAVGIKNIQISGTAGTLVTAPFTLLRRASLDTGGTAATTTALPVYAKRNSTEPAATATLVAYTANPTIVDASPVYFRTNTLTVPVTSAGTSSSLINWRFGTSDDWFERSVDLVAGGTEQVCINLNAVTITSPLLYISIDWIEG